MTEPLRLWSVTSLLSAGLGNGDAIIGWSWKTAAEAAVEMNDEISSFLRKGDRERAIELIKGERWRKRSAALARGSEVHKAAEALAKGAATTIDEKMLPWVDQYRKFLDEWAPRFELAEAPVYSLRHRYAGTLDAVVEIDGRTCVLDMKTTDRGPEADTRPPYSEVALQLCAYARAELVGISPAVMRYDGGRRYYVYDPDAHAEPMPAVDGALALVVSPSDYTLTPVRIDEEVEHAWHWVRAVAHWQLDVSKRVLGPPIGRRTS
jgi:hypothetical protein